MVREVKKINIRQFRRQFLYLIILIAGASCSILDPLSLTYDQDRQRILEEILRRNRVYNIRKSDEAALISLLDEPDPEIRLAVVKLMEANPSENVYDALIQAYQDEDENVSSEAGRVMLDSWEESYKAVIRGLNADASGTVYASIDLIRQKGRREEAPYLLTLFADERPTVRSRASRVFVELGAYEHPWFQQLLESSRPLVRQTAVETLPRFDNPEIIPLLINTIHDPVPEVSRAAIFGISEFDQDALPYLHETLRFSEDKALRLSVMELVDGILEAESIPVLIELLDDEDNTVSAKSSEMLFRQGVAAVPLLADAMPGMTEGGLLLAIELIGRYLDVRGLPALIREFGNPTIRIRLAAVDAMMSFHENAYPSLIDALDDGDSQVRYLSLLLLAEKRAPQLVYDFDTDAYPVDRIFYFFETLDESSVREYLEEAELSAAIHDALVNLYEIELNTRLYQSVRAIRDAENFPYLFYFRSWEDDLISAELSRQASFSYMHYYFETGMEEWLAESRQLRDTAALFDKSAGAALNRALREGRISSEEDRQAVREYLKSRETLSDSWRALDEEIQSLALLVFLRHSLDIQSVIRDFDFFRIVPEGATAFPDNL